MEGGIRSALIVASYDYEDPGLRRLRAPARDAEALGDVLRDPAIGGFEVRTVLNEPAHVVNLAVEEFFAGRDPDDLLLLHFSGHGVKDESGDLYFAAANTRIGLLGATAVASDFVNRRMNRTRSRRVVLLLDCCYAGAFERGMATRGGPSLDIGERLGGRGRAVITASTAMEYAFEGQELAETTEAQPSVFTSALVDGLRTGEADADQDGFVGLDELYEYIYDKVRAATPNQTPSKWAFGFQGELVIAQRSQPVTTPSPLPDELKAALDSSLAAVRMGAVEELGNLLTGRHAGLALGARQALEQLRRDDSRKVAAAAGRVLAASPLAAPVAASVAPTVPDSAPPTVIPTVPPTEPVEPQVVATPVVEAQPAPVRTTEVVALSPPRPSVFVRHRFVGAGAAALLAAVVGGVLLLGDDDPSPKDDVVARVPGEALVLTESVDGTTRLVTIDPENQEYTLLKSDPLIWLPTVSPDRDKIIYLKKDSLERGSPSAPYIMNADGTDDHAFFDESSPCQYSSRPAWRGDGEQLAVVCVEPDGATSGLFVVDSDGQLVRQLDTRGAPSGAPTWAQNNTIVYAKQPNTAGGPSTLWSIDPAQPDASPRRLTNGRDGSDSHPDWEYDGGLLFLRASPGSPTGDVWVWRNGSPQPEPLTTTGGIEAPTWAPGATAVAYLTRPDGGGRQLWTQVVGEDEPRLMDGITGVPGTPAWGSR